MEALNILVLSSWYPHRYDPYIGNFVKRHCESIARQHKVWVIHVVNERQEEKPGVEKKQQGNLTEILLYQRRSGFPLLDYLRKRALILKTIGAEGVSFDLLHAHVLYPLAPLFSAVAKKLVIPWVFSEHWSGFHPEFRPSVSSVKWSWIIRSANTAQRGFPVSKNLADSLANLLTAVPLYPVANVVGDEFFKAKSELTHSASDRLNFLHVSTLDERYKNISGTLEAFQRLKSAGFRFSFLIISDGPLDRAKGKVKALDLEGEVEIRGAATSEEIAAEMMRSDAFVLFSNTENQPCVILEALSLGLPVIASSVGDIPNLVTSERGFLVEPQNTEDLANKLMEFSKRRSEFRREIVSRGTAESFSYDAVCSIFSKHYTEVLQKR